MEVKTYRAKSLQQALQLVRRDLGADAAVLHTREIGGRWLGLLGGRQIEVTASCDVHVPSLWEDPEAGEDGLDEEYDAPAPSPEETGGDRLEGVDSLEFDEPADDVNALAPLEASESAAVETEQPSGETAAAPADVAPLVEANEYRTKFRRDLRDQLDDLQSRVAELYRRSDSSGGGALSGALPRLLAELLEAEVAADGARELVDRVRARCSPEEWGELPLLRTRLARMLEEEISCSGPIRLGAQEHRLVALVGPTGVGKTTTIAKLAAQFHLRDKKRVGLITVDTYRIAAVDQLRTYADIIDLPMEVVATPREMREALTRLSDLDLILMDTAGRSPGDDLKLLELRALLAEAQPDEVHLVLSSVASWSSMRHAAEQFGSVGVSALILTKLDEAPGLGEVLPLLRRGRLPLSYVTTGQNVPHDLAVAEARSLVRQLLRGNEET